MTGVAPKTQRETEMTTTPQPSSSSPKRKSWFSLGRLVKFSNQSKDQLTPSLTQDASLAGGPPFAFRDPAETLRPIQFSPNRIATLYVTPSERNLYLAAMSQLDEGPPPLPLWSEPPPAIPQLKVQKPFEPLSIPTPNGHLESMSEGTQHQHPLTSRPLIPKLVTSPGMNPSGLMIRDEFRRAPPPKAIKHALLALSLPASMRLTGFPAPALIAVSEALQEGWPLGVLSRSIGVDELKRWSEQDTPACKVTLEGRAWKRKGHQELDSIRLLLAVLSALGTHGWTVVDSIQIAAHKKDAHNLLFAYSAEVAAAPPVFFALSMPLPDRISIISPPAKATPALIAAVRSVLVANSPLNHSRQGTADTGITTSTESSAGGKKKSKVAWNGNQEQGIKLEGWVHKGVYRFWLDGMRRWIGGGVKRNVVDALHPRLILSLIDLFSTIHFEFTASIPLLPITKGRDILFFASSPSSGLSPKDRYISIYKGSSSSSTEIRSESPVVVSTTASMAAPELMGVASTNPRVMDPENRTLPWNSSVQTGPRERSGSRSPIQSPVPPSATPSQNRCTPSLDSSRPLIHPPVSSQTNPRHRNVLVKKSSLRSRHTPSRQGSIRQPSDTSKHHLTAEFDDLPQPMEDYYPQLHVINATSSDVDEWSIVNPLPNVGAPDVSAHHNPAPTSPVHHERQLTNEDEWDFDLGQRQSGEHTIESGESVYVDADGQPQPQTHEVTEQYINTLQEEGHSPESEIGAGSELNHAHPLSKPLRLGQPINQPNESDLISTVPSKESISPRRVRQGLVDVGGVNSVHGSVGYSQSVLSRKSQEGVLNHTQSQEGAKLTTSNEQPRLSGGNATRPQGGSFGYWDKKGKGKEGTRRIWDEYQGMWVDVPVDGSSALGMSTSDRELVVAIREKGVGTGEGSSRTRVKLS